MERQPAYTVTERDIIRETCRMAARKYGLDEKLFLRQIKQESAFNPLAESGSCKGLGQISLDFYPLSDEGYWPHGDWRNVEDNANLAAYIMAGYMKVYNGNILKALAAYNAGPVTLALAMQRAETTDISGCPVSWLSYMPPVTLYYIDQIVGGGVGDD